jgi:hypothetical protein
MKYMSYERDSEIYTTFKGAGGPGAPPPQRPGSNPTRMWQMFFVVCVIAFIAALICAAFVYQGEYYLKALVSSLCAGVATAVVDWMIEVYAAQKGYWFMYGGHTRLGRINSHTIPMEMSFGFIFLGAGGAILSYLPLLVRFLGITTWPFYDPNLDFLTVIVIVLIISISGACVDFIVAKRNGALMNGPNWHFVKHVVTIYFPIEAIAMVTVRIPMAFLYASMDSFLIAAGIVLLVYIVAPLLFNQFYIKKYVKK